MTSSVHDCKDTWWNKQINLHILKYATQTHLNELTLITGKLLTSKSLRVLCLCLSSLSAIWLIFCNNLSRSSSITDWWKSSRATACRSRNGNAGRKDGSNIPFWTWYKILRQCFIIPDCIQTKWHTYFVWQSCKLRVWISYFYPSIRTKIEHQSIIQVACRLLLLI